MRADLLGRDYTAEEAFWLNPAGNRELVEFAEPLPLSELWV